MSEDGWKQIRAGLSLIQWSHLARWNHACTALVATANADFEMTAGNRHAEFGRLISWLVFTAGSEYVLKGACMLKGLIVGKSKKVLRPPVSGEDLASWTQMVIAKNPTVYTNDTSLGTLGDLPISGLLKDLPEKDLVMASIDLLRQTIRNRDVHRYTRNVRASHFHAVPQLFVPALNAVLVSLDQSELRSQLSGVGDGSSSAA